MLALPAGAEELHACLHEWADALLAAEQQLSEAEDQADGSVYDAAEAAERRRQKVQRKWEKQGSTAHCITELNFRPAFDEILATLEQKHRTREALLSRERVNHWKRLAMRYVQQVQRCVQ